MPTDVEHLASASCEMAFRDRHTYDDLVTLARICAKNARLANTKEVARTLWEMANEYRNRAMATDSG
jgi:hypothetical protein